MSRQFKTGEWFIAKEDIVAKNAVLVPAGEEARIMVYDPSKGETPYGIRTVTGFITEAYVAESVMVKNPARAHETPKGA